MAITDAIASTPPAEHDTRPQPQPNDTASIQPPQAASVAPPPQAPAPVEYPVEFVCEDDVRQAVRASRRIVVNDRTIITPAARDLGEQHRVFIEAELPR